MNLKRILWSGVLAVATFAAAPAYADTVWGTIVNIGCHHADGTCFVTLDDGSPPFDNCPDPKNPTTTLGKGHQFRWDDGHTENGKRTFAALYAAFLAGRKVGIEIAGCTSQNAPSLAWFIVG